MICRRIVSVGLLVSWLLASPRLMAQPVAINFGSVAMDVPSVMHKRLTPLIKYLSQSLGQPVNLMLANDMPEAIRDISSGAVDLAYLTPVAYVRSKEIGNTQIIAKMKTHNKASFKLMIVVKEDSDIHEVGDVIGRSFAFGDEAALLQRAVVVGAGLPLEKLGSYEFLRHYDNIVRAILLGEYDAGILKDTTAYKWANKGVRVIYSSPDLPPYNIVASSKVSHTTLARLKAAFLNLDTDNPEHYKIIKSLDKNYDGFAEASDADYDIVRQLIKPFSK